MTDGKVRLLAKGDVELSWFTTKSKSASPPLLLCLLFPFVDADQCCLHSEWCHLPCKYYGMR
jgi:hypothetical protein